MGVAEDIMRLEQDLRELIMKYDQYFFGVEKREPLRQLENVERLARRYQNVAITNTMHRFKYESLISTLCVHRQKWTRINRLIEEGKFERGMKSAQSRRTAPEGEEGTATETLDGFDQQVERVYREYCDARLACNLPVENVTREKIAEVIRQRIPTIREKYRCDQVEFFVAVENGKPSLKARQKKP